MSARGELAAMHEDLARWIEDEIAGGAPAKWVAWQAAAAVRHIAETVRDGEHTESIRTESRRERGWPDGAQDVDHDRQDRMGSWAVAGRAR